MIGVIVLKEQTLNGEIRFAGKGLHTGKKCQVILCPAPPGTGVVFKRSDLPEADKAVIVPAHIMHACKLIRCSGLLYENVRVRTCEHLLAALSMARIDNVVIELTSEEIPIFDGSATFFVKELNRVGGLQQNITRRYIRIVKTVEVCDGERFVRISPREDYSIELSLTLDGFSGLCWKGVIDSKSFQRDICWARTFSPLKHALPMKILSTLVGLPIARGASMNNLLVFGKGKIYNPGEKGAEKEFARHRVLDIVGDLALLGYPILGHVTAFRSSHSLNQGLAKKIWLDKKAWEFVSATEIG